MTQDKIDWDKLLLMVQCAWEGDFFLSEENQQKIEDALKVAKDQSEAVEKFDVHAHVTEGGKIYIPDNYEEGEYLEYEHGAFYNSVTGNCAALGHVMAKWSEFKPYEEPPMPQPSDGSYYWVWVEGEYYNYKCVLFRQNGEWRRFSDGAAVWTDTYATPLRNPETNELYEVTVPDLKGGE